MAGIYFHIPFCKTRCTYCDFYTTTQISQLSVTVQSLIKELELRKHEFEHETVSTIYFGGGTPTLLKSNQLKQIIERVFQLFTIENEVEITVEANPDDLNLEYLQALRNMGVNRLSIGIQSFSDKVLRFMNRRHNAQQAVEAIAMARQAGFENLSIDLIYGIPEVSENEWQSILNQALELNSEHISAYHLTYHEDTPLWTQLQKGVISEIEEDESLKQFKMLVDEAEKRGYTQYEISNFARSGCYSKHNSSYWKQIAYLGVGPSAHSYNKISRRWNISNLHAYIQGISKGEVPHAMEVLSIEDRFNEYLITTMRTIWGSDLNYIEQEFGSDFFNFLISEIQKFIDSNHLYINQNRIYFTKLGLFISDHILSELIRVKN
jgi:putative oxygen-independent coproporphyrinogen III oxidase